MQTSKFIGKAQSFGAMKILRGALLCTLLSALFACASVDSTAPAPEPLTDVLESEYRIGISDELQISVWKNPDLSVAVPVRPDGKISVPLAGDVVAAGNSAEELANLVSTALSEFIRSPQVTVIVTSANSAAFLQRVRITGAVVAPQSIPYRQGMNVLDVVLQAGGLTPFAVGNDALLYRQTKDGLKKYPIYLKDILEKGRLKTNYELAPSDILTIPQRSF
jgi:polysaccharide export outer membrane protein